MNASPLQTKRCPRKGRFRLLHARTARRKQRVAATGSAADLDSDQPNLSVARALVVFLLIHVVAISGIFVHNRFFDKSAGQAEVAESQPAQSASVLPDRPREPVIERGDRPYMVKTGDTYARIAAAEGVVEEDLRRLNDNLPLRSGRILKLPSRRIVALEPVEMERIRAAGRDGQSRGLVEEASLAATATAVLVRPNLSPEALASAPRATVVEAAPASSGATHTVTSGDTLWRIANRYKVTTDALMQLNGIDDPRKLKVGMNLKIPAAR